MTSVDPSFNDHYESISITPDVSRMAMCYRASSKFETALLHHRTPP